MEFQTNIPIEEKERINHLRPVTVGALRTKETGTPVVDLFENLVNKTPCDIVIGPEYAFAINAQIYPSQETTKKPQPLHFELRNGIYYPLDGNPQTLESITRLSNLARDSQTNMCIGTVCEEETFDGVPIQFESTAVVLNNKGQIVQLRRKFTSGDMLMENRPLPFSRIGLNSNTIMESIRHPTPEQKISAMAIQSALNTIKPIHLKTKQGDEIVALVMVCAEAQSENDGSFNYLKQAKQTVTTPVDAMLLTFQNGNDYFTERSQMELYNQLDKDALPNSNYKTYEKADQSKKEEMLSDYRKWYQKGFAQREKQGTQQPWSLVTLRQQAVAKGIVSPRSIWVASDGGNGTPSVGIFPTSERNAIKNTHFTQQDLTAECLL